MHRGDATTSGGVRTAVLVGADLSGGNLGYANLWGVDLTDANLRGARFTGASLTGVIWSHTTCPGDSNSDTRGDPCVGYGV